MRQAESQHRVAGGLEMVDVADALGGRSARRRAGPSAAPCARSAAGRAGPRRSANSRSKTKKTRSSVLPSDSAACRAGEVRRAGGVRARTTSPSIDAVGQGGPGRRRSPGSASVQSRPLRVSSRRLAALDAQLQAVAVELDLVAPARARRRPVHRAGELRRDEAGQGGGLGRRAGFALPASLASRPRRAPWSARPRRPARRLGRVMNGLGPRPRPSAISSIGAARGDRAGLAPAGRRGRPRGAQASSVLDQQPVGALAAARRRFMRTSTQPAVQPLAVQDELQLAPFRPCSADRCPSGAQ